MPTTYMVLDDRHSVVVPLMQVNVRDVIVRGSDVALPPTIFRLDTFHD